MPSEERLLGAIEATVNGIANSQSVMHSEFRDFRKATETDRKEIMGKLEKTSTSIAGIDARIHSHVSDDNRRFSLLWRVVLSIAGVVGVVFGLVKVLQG